MITPLMSRQHVTTNYLKIEKEAPEEIQHRKAQFLIYKSLNKADTIVSMRKNVPWLKVKFCKLKIKIGRKLKSLRKSILLTFSVAKSGFYKQFISHLKYLKSLLEVQKTIVSLPPVFTSSSI